MNNDVVFELDTSSTAKHPSIINPIILIDDPVRLSVAVTKLVLGHSLYVVFTDLSPDRADEFFDDVLQDLGVRSYEDDGLVMGALYEGNEGPAIYNRRFRPFISPVPFLLIRQAATSDWKFFLDDEAWLKLWAQR